MTKLRALLVAIFASVAVLAVLPVGTARAAEPAECAPLQLFSGNQPYAQDAASLMAVGKLFDARDQKVEVWDTARGKPEAAYTLYEAMGMSGATWSTSKMLQQEQFKEFEPRTEYACAYLPPTVSMMANSVFDLSKLTSAAAISFRGLAANPQLVIDLLDQAVAPVNQLSTGLFLGMSVVMIMLTGLLVVVTGGLRGPGKQRETLQALIGVGVFMVAGTFLVLPSTQHSEQKPNYYWITSAALNTVNDGNAALASTLLPNQPSPLCSSSSGDARRTFDCLIYQNTVLEPWALGQFGRGFDRAMPFRTGEVKRFKDPANKLIPQANQDDSDVRLVQLWAQGRTSSEVTWGDRPPGNPADANNDKVNERQGQWNITREVMWSQYHDQFWTWQGANSGERVNLAFFSMLLSLLVGIFLVVTSGLLLVWNSVLVALFFFLPVVALLGLFPPTQRMFRAWLMTWFKAILLSFVFQLLQTVAMLVVTAALKLPSTGMGMKAVLMVVLLLGLWKVVGLLRGDPAPVNETGPAEQQARIAAAVTSSPAVALSSGGGQTTSGRLAGGGPAGATRSGQPGVRRSGLAQTLNASGSRRQDAKVAAALAQAEEKWVHDHGTTVDEHTRGRLRAEVVRSLGLEEGSHTGSRSAGALSRIPGLGAVLGAGVRGRDAREQAADKLSAQSGGQQPGQPSMQVNTTNYNYFRGAPARARASEAAAAGMERGARGEDDLEGTLRPAGPGLRRASGSQQQAPGLREQANESRSMEAAFRRSLSTQLDDRGMALARADHFAGQLREAQQSFDEARRARDAANREFQLVTGRHSKGLASEDELHAARSAARQASANLSVATNRLQHRTQLTEVAEQAASEFR